MASIQQARVPWIFYSESKTEAEISRPIPSLQPGVSAFPFRDERLGKFWFRFIKFMAGVVCIPSLSVQVKASDGNTSCRKSWPLERVCNNVRSFWNAGFVFLVTGLEGLGEGPCERECVAFLKCIFCIAIVSSLMRRNGQLLQNKTRQKGLQINSGPMCAFVFILLASRRSDSKLVIPRNHQATVVSC